MSDIFISYARMDKVHAAELVSRFAAEGWSVWWDDSLRAGSAYDDQIENMLKEAQCVVVLWSSHSVASRWVKAEAAIAGDRNKLVPVLIEDVEQPLPHGRTQAINLTGLLGAEREVALTRLVDDVHAILETSRDIHEQPKTIGDVRTAFAEGSFPRSSERLRLFATPVIIVSIAIAMGFAPGRLMPAPVTDYRWLASGVALITGVLAWHRNVRLRLLAVAAAAIAAMLILVVLNLAYVRSVRFNDGLSWYITGGAITDPTRCGPSVEIVVQQCGGDWPALEAVWGARVIIVATIYALCYTLFATGVALSIGVAGSSE